MRSVEYRSQGAPLEPYEPTKADHRRQKEAERMREYVKRNVADAPPPTPAQLERLRRLFSVRTPDYELMRWRLRLYCGHIVEMTQHHDQQQPSGFRACPDCGLDPASVVAYEPLGRVAETPGPRQLPPAARSRSTRQSAGQQEIIELEQEVARLRARLGEVDVAPG